MQSTVKPMSSADTAWLRMDSPTNLMTITGVMVLQSPITLDALRSVVASRFGCYDRFRMCPRHNAISAWWENDPDFAIENQVVELDGKNVSDKAGLEALASEIAGLPFDTQRPRWQFQLLSHYDGGSAVICRIHHCYADGIALIQVLLSMTDTEANPTPHAGAPPKRQHTERGLLDQIFHDARALQKRGSATGAHLIHEARSPDHGRAALGGILHQGRRLATDIGRVIFRPPDAKTRYRGRQSPSKRVAWADPIALDEVKTIARVHGCTVNDVLLASVAGALRGWLTEQGQAVDGVEIHATVPVNMRPPALTGELGNHFGVVFLGIPVGIGDPIARLRAVSRSMTELKRSFQPKISLALLALTGRGPGVMQKPVLELFSSKASVVITNVPGPQQPLYLAGAEIDKLLFWVPQSGSIGLGISILSYNGKVQFGMISDRNLVARPAQIMRRAVVEFENLVLLTLMDASKARVDTAATGAQHD